jgi:hypothetical protein
VVVGPAVTLVVVEVGVDGTLVVEVEVGSVVVTVAVDPGARVVEPASAATTVASGVSLTLDPAASTAR